MEFREYWAALGKDDEPVRVLPSAEELDRADADDFQIARTKKPPKARTFRSRETGRAGRGDGSEGKSAESSIPFRSPLLHG